MHDKTLTRIIVTRANGTCSACYEQKTIELPCIRP
jgi:hypothetical protein